MKRSRTSLCSAGPRAPRSTPPPRLAAASARCHRLHVDGHGRLASLRDERGFQALVGKQRRVDAAREIAQVLEGRLRFRFDLFEHRRGFRRVALGERAGEPGLHGERHELLLGAVVDVALEPASLAVLCGDEALLRRLQLVEAATQLPGQPLVPQHEARLRGEVAHELLPVRIDRVVGRHGAPRARRATLLGAAPRRTKSSSRAGASEGQVATVRSSSPSASRTSARSAPTPSPEHPGGAGQHVLRRVRARELTAERRHHLVGRGSLAEDEPVREMAGSRPHGLEDQRDDGRRDRGEQRAPFRAGDRADARHHRRVDERDARGHDREHDGLADHEVDVVEAVAQDRDADRDGDRAGTSRPRACRGCPPSPPLPTRAPPGATNAIA